MGWIIFVLLLLEVLFRAYPSQITPHLVSYPQEFILHHRLLWFLEVSKNNQPQLGHS